MNNQPEDELNDPFDDEMDSAMIVAAQLITHVKQMHSAELELSVMD
jgi:hypothetical protein